MVTWGFAVLAQRRGIDAVSPIDTNAAQKNGSLRPGLRICASCALRIAQCAARRQGPRQPDLVALSARRPGRRVRARRPIRRRAAARAAATDDGRAALAGRRTGARVSISRCTLASANAIACWTSSLRNSAGNASAGGSAAPSTSKGVTVAWGAASARAISSRCTSSGSSRRRPRLTSSANQRGPIRTSMTRQSDNAACSRMRESPAASASLSRKTFVAPNASANRSRSSSARGLASSRR